MSASMLIMLGAVLGEVVLLALVLLGVAYLRNRAQRRRDLNGVQKLIARIKHGKPEREKTIMQFLEQGMGLSGEALQQSRVAILRAELGLLQRIAGIYRQRDAAALARIDDDLFAATDPYHALNATLGAATMAESAPVDEHELEQLRQENHRLSEELTITMETMSRMLNEYSNMFAGGDPAVAAAGAAAADEAVADEEKVMIASPGAAGESAAATEDAEPVEVGEVEIAASVPVAEDDGTDADVPADDIEVAAGDQDAEAIDDVIVAPSLTGDGDQEADGIGDTLPDGAPELEPDGMPDKGDEIAAILREAQSQEVSARVGEGPDDAGVSGDEGVAAANVQESSQPVDLDAAFDDLFDAAGEDIADEIIDNTDPDKAEAAENEPPLTSQGGG